MNAPRTVSAEDQFWHSHHDTDSAKKACAHCGTSFRPRNPADTFCCSGCAFVHEMITGEGLDQFYDLKGSTTTRPVENLAFEQRDYDWLREKCLHAEKTLAQEASANLEVGLDGASCAGCVWLIERLFGQEDGALRCFTDPLLGRLEFTWEKGQFDAPAFAQKLQQFGYTLCPLDEQQRLREKARDPLLSRLGLCAAFAMNGMAFTLPRYLGMPADFMFASLFQLLTALSATLALAVGGSYFIKRAWQAIPRGLVHVDVPIALGIVLAYAGSLLGWLLGLESMLYFDFVAIFVFLMLGGRWLQEQAMRQNRRRLFERNAVPRTVLVDGSPLATAELQTGQIYQIEPNQVIPVASRLLSDSASLGMEWIQGESDTRRQTRGSVALSGAINRGQRAIELEARETWPQSLLFRLTENQESHAQYPFLQRILQVYLGFVLVAGLIGGLAWAVAGGDVYRGLQVALSIFVISCPCALGIAVPLADEAAASAARKLGVFVQQLSFWSRLRRVRHVLFDKTGTLTLETPEWTNPQVADSLDSEALRILAGMTATSPHPVSRSITQHLLAHHGLRESLDVEQVEELPGTGLLYQDPQEVRWTLSKPQGGRDADSEFRRDGQRLATFTFADTLRDGAREEISHLEDLGLQTHILSGDRIPKVARLAHALELPPERWHARMNPDEKATRVAQIDHDNTLYIGDGANDSLAFDRAYATATPAFDRNFLTNKADCYFVTRGLTFLTPLLRLAKRRQGCIRGVFVFAAGYNVAAIVVCLMGLMNPLLAAILMPISSVITTGIVALGFRRP